VNCGTTEQAAICSIFKQLAPPNGLIAKRTMQSNAPNSLVRNLAYAALAIGAVVLTSILGQIATYPNLTPWYAGLAKPPFNPPNWVFAPVWTTLYALIAFAFWRVLRAQEPTEERRWAIGAFIGQLVLNAAWSWMFFGAHNPALGLMNIIPQFFVVIATIVAFWQVDRIAAFCMVPLAAWVAFAATLNASIWWLNS